MKTNTLHFVSFCCTSLAIGYALVIIGGMGTAKAQNTVPKVNQSVLNGLFSPTAAERFFEKGRRDIEREAEILSHPERYRREDILKIDRNDIKTIEETEKTKTIYNSPEETPQQELD